MGELNGLPMQRLALHVSNIEPLCVNMFYKKKLLKAHFGRTS